MVGSRDAAPDVREADQLLDKRDLVRHSVREEVRRTRADERAAGLEVGEVVELGVEELLGLDRRHTNAHLGAG